MMNSGKMPLEGNFLRKFRGHSIESLLEISSLSVKKDVDILDYGLFNNLKTKLWGGGEGMGEVDLDFYSLYYPPTTVVTQQLQ